VLLTTEGLRSNDLHGALQVNSQGVVDAEQVGEQKMAVESGSEPGSARRGELGSIADWTYRLKEGS
jgi:hypothetical protein